MYGSADQHCVISACSLKGNTCPYCSATPDSFCATDEKSLDDFKKSERTLHQTKLLAHTICGTCPGCKLKIVPKGQVRDARREVEVCERTDGTDELPAGHPKIQQLHPFWTDIHLGVVYGMDPLMQFDNIHWIICLLHCNLRITGGLWNWAIRGGDIRGDYQDTSKTMAIVALLAEVGITIRPLPKPVGNLQGFWGGLKLHSFHGEEALALNAIRHKLIEIAYPEAECGDDPELKLKREHILACWNLWAGEDSAEAEEDGLGLWGLLCTKPDDGQAQWDAHAALVQAKSTVRPVWELNPRRLSR